MAFLSLTLADGGVEVVEANGEPRVQISGGSSAALATGTGVVSAKFVTGDAVLSEPDWDDPTFRRKVRKMLAEETPAAEPTLTLGYADGSEAVFVSEHPTLEAGLGSSIPFNADSGLVSVTVTDDDPREKKKAKK